MRLAIPRYMSPRSGGRQPCSPCCWRRTLALTLTLTLAPTLALLLKAYGEGARVPNAAGDLPLHVLAAGWGNTPVVVKGLSAGAGGGSVAREGAVRILLAAHPAGGAVPNHAGVRPWACAAESGAPKEVVALLQGGDATAGGAAEANTGDDAAADDMRAGKRRRWTPGEEEEEAGGRERSEQQGEAHKAGGDESELSVHGYQIVEGVVAAGACERLLAQLRVAREAMTEQVHNGEVDEVALRGKRGGRG
jgi:hypothetical protein